MKKRNLLKQLMLTLSFFLLGGVSAWAQGAQRQTYKAWTFNWSDDTKYQLNLTTFWRRDANVCYYNKSLTAGIIERNGIDLVVGLNFTGAESNFGFRSSGLFMKNATANRIHLPSLSAGNIVKITSLGGTSENAQYLVPEAVSDETIKVKNAVNTTQTSSQTYSYEIVAGNSYNLKLANNTGNLAISSIAIYETAESETPIDGKIWDFSDIIFTDEEKNCIPIKVNSTYNGLMWNEWTSNGYQNNSTLTESSELKAFNSVIAETDDLGFVTTGKGKVRVKTANNTLFLQSDGGNVITVPNVSSGGRVIIVTDNASRITDSSDNAPSSTENSEKTYIFNVESAGSFSFKNTGDISISSISVEGPEYATVSKAAGIENGDISFSADDADKEFDKDNAESLLGYIVGKTITITASPVTGYHLASISAVDAEEAAVTLSGDGNTRTFTMPAKNVTVTATFAKDQYTLSSSATNGTVTMKYTNSEGETIASGTNIDWGTTVYVSAAPTSSDYYFTSLKYDDIDVAIGGTFEMPKANTTVAAVYTAKTNLSTAEDVVITLSSNSFTYTGSAQAPTVTKVQVGSTELVLDTDYTVDAIAQQTDVSDSYTVSVTGKGIYMGQKTTTWAITPANASVTAPPAAVASNLTYTGEPQALVTAGEASNGTLKYFVNATGTAPTTETDGWTETVPQKTDAGTYYVWYYVEASGNYSSTAVTAIEGGSKAITPATISSVAITGITAPKKDVALDVAAACATTGITSTTPAVTWKVGDTEKTGQAEANKDYTAYVTLTADANYQFVEAPLATGTINGEAAIVSRTDANNIIVSYTFPTTGKIAINPSVSLTGWTYGSAANTPTVEGNTGNGEVTYQYKLASAAEEAYSTFDNEHYPTAAGEYNIKANIAANGDYAAGSAVNTFTIAKAALSSLSVSITGWAWGEYNLTTNAPQVSGNTGNGTETIEYKGQTAEDYTYVTQIPIDAGNYTVRVSVAETDNYQAGSATANFTVVTATNYSVTLPAASNGNSITATKTSNAHVGDEITLTINTNDNYTLKSIYGDHSIELSTVQNQPTKRKFTMPAADVTITATWEEKTEGNAKTQITEEVKIEGDNAEITKVDMAETTTTVTISSSVGGKTVTSIDAAAFSGLTNDQKANLQTVDLSSTGIVLTMARDAGDSPFRDLDANTLVYLPEGSSMAGQNVIIKDGANYSCTQFVMTDAKSYDIPHAFSATSAFLVRDFTNGQTCTVCLPFSVPAVNIPGKIYRFTSISGNQVTMTEDTDGLDANVPYILVPNEDDNINRYGGGITVQITGATAENDNFTFKGIYEDHTFTAAEISKGIYGFAGNNAVGATPGHFAKAATGAYIKGMRAYLEYTGGSTDPGLNGADIPSGARGESANELPEILNVVLVNADGSTTSIGKLELVDVDDDSTPRYNLSGQRVDKSYKGIVIINGKKVIIK